jgi:hypothetical protein
MHTQPSLAFLTSPPGARQRKAAARHSRPTAATGEQAPAAANPAMACPFLQCSFLQWGETSPHLRDDLRQLRLLLGRQRCRRVGCGLSSSAGPRAGRAVTARPTSSPLCGAIGCRRLLRAAVAAGCCLLASRVAPSRLLPVADRGRGALRSPVGARSGLRGAVRASRRLLAGAVAPGRRSCRRCWLCGAIAGLGRCLLAAVRCLSARGSSS